MHKLWQKINNFTRPRITRKKAVVAVICLVLVGVFIYTMPAYAILGIGWDFGNWFTKEVLLRIAAFLGKILLAIIEILIAIVQYNDFVNNPAVQTGWSVVRDVCNMFFILVLLVIAFGTVFKIETYRYNRLLGRLIMMAVLINFSKMIAGFFIDISQVVLLTFVNGFKDTAAGNFTSAFGLRDMLGFSTGQENAPTGTEALGIGLMAIVMTVIAMVVMIVMVVVFLIRIIMLWILVVLSPLAYLLYAFPGQAQQYSHRWWSSFGKYVATGPVLAFFIWLGLAVITGFGQEPGRNMSKDILKVTANEDIVKSVVEPTGTGAEDLQATASKAGSSTGILNFIISIAMFVGALMIAQQMGGVAGNFAGGAIGKLRGVGMGAVKAGLAPLRGLQVGAKWTGRRLDDMQAGIQRRLASSKLMQKVAGSKIGERLGLEGVRQRLEIHGVQMRAIKPGWKARAAKKEEERLGEAVSVAQDVFNRVVPVGKEKSDYATIARASRVNKAKSEISAAGEEKELLLHKWRTEIVDSNGKVNKGKEADAEALLRILISRHDINEPNKLPFIADLMKKYGKGAGKVDQESLVQLLKHTFGDKHDTKRIAKNLEEYGLAGNDSWVKGIVDFDTSRGEFEWQSTQRASLDVKKHDWRKDEAAKTSSFYNKKRPGRSFIGAQRRQDYLTERADDEGNLHFREINNTGKWNIVQNVGELLKVNNEHYQGEFSDALRDNLDLLLEWEKTAEQTGELDTDQRQKLHQLAQKLASAVRGRSDADFNRMKKEPAGSLELDEDIIAAVKERQNGDFWKKTQQINENREKNGWNNGDTYTEEGMKTDEGIYQNYLKTGKVENKRIDWLENDIKRRKASAGGQKGPSGAGAGAGAGTGPTGPGTGPSAGFKAGGPPPGGAPPGGGGAGAGTTGGGGPLPTAYQLAEQRAKAREYKPEEEKIVIPKEITEHEEVQKVTQKTRNIDQRIDELQKEGGLKLGDVNKTLIDLEGNLNEFSVALQKVSKDLGQTDITKQGGYIKQMKQMQNTIEEGKRPGTITTVEQQKEFLWNLKQMVQSMNKMMGKKEETTKEVEKNIEEETEI